MHKASQRVAWEVQRRHRCKAHADWTGIHRTARGAVRMRNHCRVGLGGVEWVWASSSTAGGRVRLVPPPRFVEAHAHALGCRVVPHWCGGAARQACWGWGGGSGVGRTQSAGTIDSRPPPSAIALPLTSVLANRRRLAAALGADQCGTLYKRQDVFAVVCLAHHRALVAFWGRAGEPFFDDVVVRLGGDECGG